MKKLLFVGFRNKKRLIESSQKFGYKFVLLINQNEFKDEYKNIFEKVIIVKNIFDWDEVFQALKKEKFDGVMTRYEDYTALVAAIADEFSLPGSSYKNALKSRNKYLMRKAFAEKNVASADFALVNEIRDAQEMIQKHGFPLILKQIAGIHSRYVFKVKSKEKLQEKLDFLHKALASDNSLLSENLQNYPHDIRMPNPKRYFLLEEVLKGEELTVDALICDGEILMTPICKYVTSEEVGLNDHHLPIRIMPYQLPEADIQIILKTVEDSLKALELNYCATHTEVFFNPKTKDCRLIEVASRAGGFRAEMFETVTKGDLDLAIVQTVLGEKPIVPNEVLQCAAVVEIFSPENGILENIDFEFLYDDEAVTDITINKDVGKKVGLAQEGGKYIVKFMLNGAVYEDCLKKSMDYLEKIQNTIQVA